MLNVYANLYTSALRIIWMYPNDLYATSFIQTVHTSTSSLYSLNLISRYCVVGLKKGSRVLNVNSANEQGNIYNILEKCKWDEITCTTQNKQEREEYNHKRLRISVPCLVFHLLGELYNCFSTIIIFSIQLSSYLRCMLIDKTLNRKFYSFFFVDLYLTESIAI